MMSNKPDLAAMVSRFETQVGEIVGRFRGRVVKLIGDEAMFVVDDRTRGCDLACSLGSRREARVLPRDYEPGLVGEHDELRAVAHGELGEQA